MMKRTRYIAMALALCITALSATELVAAPAVPRAEIETLAKKRSWPPEAKKMEEHEAIQFSQGVIGRQIRDAEFTDHNGNKVRFSDFAGKPLIVSFIYTQCADVCPTITTSLNHAVDEARRVFGEDKFEVLTIGFDTRFDTPKRLKIFADREGAGSGNWRFLSGDLISIAQASDDLGFMFFRSPKGFDHLSQVTVVDEKQVVYRQVYGDKFDVPHVIEPLKDVIFHTQKSYFTPEGFWNRLRLFCTTYNVQADKYEFDYSIFVSMFAGATVMIVPIWVVFKTAWRRRRDAKRANMQNAG